MSRFAQFQIVELRTNPIQRTSCLPLGRDVLVGRDPTTCVWWGSLNCTGWPDSPTPSSPCKQGKADRLPRLEDFVVGAGTGGMGVPPASAAVRALFFPLMAVDQLLNCCAGAVLDPLALWSHLCCHRMDNEEACKTCYTLVNIFQSTRLLWVD